MHHCVILQKKKKKKGCLPLLLGGRVAEDVGHNVENLRVLLLGQAALDLLDARVQLCRRCRTHVEDHNQLALGQVVAAQPLDEARHGVGAVLDRLLAQWAGR